MIIDYLKDSKDHLQGKGQHDCSFAIFSLFDQSTDTWNLKDARVFFADLDHALGPDRDETHRNIYKESLVLQISS